jgi:uncharacterized protein (DUF4415 family)
MAKRDLASLMNGIIGEKTLTETQEVENNDTQVAAEVTDEMKENLEARRKRNVGRPRKDETGSKSNEVRATFIVDPDLLRKVKYISLVEGNLLKDVINSALQEYINAWESKSGRIRLPKKK